MNKQGFNFEGIQRCHKLSQFNSRIFILGFTCNCYRLQKAKKFSRNPGQFKCVARETRYHISITELLIQNLQSQVPELVQRPRITLKILYFSGGHQVFQISPGLKSLYDRGKKLINLLAGKAQLGIGVAISENISTGEATGAHLTWALGQGVSVFTKSLLKFIRPCPNIIFNCHNLKGVKLIARLRLDLSHIRDQKFNHSFQDWLNPI